MSNFFEDVHLEELQLTAQGVGQIVMTNETYS